MIPRDLEIFQILETVSVWVFCLKITCGDAGNANRKETRSNEVGCGRGEGKRIGQVPVYLWAPTDGIL